MIHRFDQNDRRILTFPAVHPCEGISPTTLLESLMSLSHTICDYQTKSFATQRRNARETIRQVGILLMFLEEIRERSPNLPKAIFFSELHLTFQKILFLLEDCTREGARMWILMKAHFVASQFRVLIRSVATALDVLPLENLSVSGEIKELVELVGKQAQRDRLELDPDDGEAIKRVILILNQLENRFEPDPCVIKKVLDYLEVKTWGDCHREIKFLDEMISVESLEGHEREVPLLSSLVGFLSYCRAVLFEDSAYGVVDQLEARSGIETLCCLNPEDFRCPISLELMTDPVTVTTGQTYDRASIQKWLKAGNPICPKTGEKLTSTELVPNSSIRKLIHQFCADHGISLAKSRKKNRDISRTIVAGSKAAAEAVKLLSEFLARRLSYGTDRQRNKAAYEVRLLAKSNIFNRYCLIEAGTVPPLLDLLDSTDPSAHENAISALLKLSKHSRGKEEIIENGGLSLILRVLKDGRNQEAKQTAAATVFYLSSVYEYRKVIGETDKAIPALVELIKDGTSCGKKNAVVAIFGLLLYRRNRSRVIAAGAVPVLVDLLASSDKADLSADVLAVLSTLAETMDGSVGILQASALRLLLGLMQSMTSRQGKEYCASILLSMCNNCGDDVVAAIAQDSSLMPNLYSLLTEGTSHASKKARSLVKILHHYYDTHASRLAREVPQERFVDVW